METTKQLKYKSINGNDIINYHLVIGSYNTNKKITVYETDQLLILKSYETVICFYDKLRNGLFINLFNYKTSNTTRKHYTEFIDYLKYTKNYNIEFKIYLDYYNFRQLEKTFNSFGSIENKLNELYKLYNLEQNHIKFILNMDMDLYLKLYGKINLNNWINGLKITETWINKLKTRIKENYILYYNNSVNQNTEIKLTLTYNKNKTKLLNYKFKIVSKYGLSYNNYNTKELNNYTNYYCY